MKLKNTYMAQSYNHRFSALQYFLWLISGSEISILKKCPSDYNRHAGIGFTILMTSLFGAFSGGYAGFYFSKSWIGAIVFGLIWGLLIFSIDRTMVVSLKKRPTDTKSSYWGQILARAILAALIAFIISIPLELLVFKDNIDIGLSDYKTDRQARLQESLLNLYQPKKDSLNAVGAQANADSLQKISDSDPQDPNFKQLVANSNTLMYNYKIAKTTEHDYSVKAASYYKKSLIRDNETESWYPNKSSADYNEYLGLKKLANNSRKEANGYLAQKQSVDGEIKLLRQAHREKYNAQVNASMRMRDSLKTAAAKKGIAIDSTERVFNSNIQRIDSSFSVRFDVLSYLSKKKNAAGEREYPSIFFLLWLIRILFFIIEILPTVTKVMTPFGAYDMALFEAEENLRTIQLPAARKQLEETVNEDSTIELEERRRQQLYRAQKEGEMHDQIVDRIVSTQNEIAKKILTDWERQNGVVSK